MNTVPTQETTPARSRKNAVRPLSKDPSMAVQETMETISKMRAVYEQENNTLATSDTKGFMALQDQKMRVAEEYQSRMAALMARKDDLKSVDPDLKNQLRTMHKDFSDLVTQNKSALERMQRCMGRLSGMMHNAAKEALQKHRTTAYNADARVHDNDRRAVSTGVITTA